MPSQSGDFATPEQIIDDLWAPRATQVLLTAVELGLFSHLAAGARSAAQVAAAADCDPRATARVLDALTALGYLDPDDGGGYELTAVSRRFLVQDSPSYLGDMCRETRLLWDSWSRLTEVVRSGEPVARWEEEADGRENFPQLVSAWFPMSFGAARAAVAALPESTLAGVDRVLDVAAGSGAWSLAFALARPEVRVTTVDHPEVTEVTRTFTRSFGVADRYEHLTGDIRRVPFGEDYDLVTLGYIVHTEGPEWGRHLIERAYAALRPGGTLLIGDMIPDDDRSGPDIPLVFAATDLLLFSRDGDVFTMSDYRRWLTDAGFREVTTYDVLAPSPLLVATK
ncbi:methyltransferase [Streptomyces alkaliterrae]|uniref:Methyltransferase domain-containing protein n=1 Tax=Streptomyces alkaliterrae TaxID=2213162 RepID=A0A5P0YRS5_9ACTN|nr:methyltransferase [Streptomyces alkaliterrae]MBB1253327.1 methyltransferase domain-containing protein [Streptomyces alkaliterrae]MBB1259268.1 methyltransferase domain-containing protein [Streptomyces alkaliterrae]MQS02307.1 methyltransferase domain-containing protein [Streptomyces alkaliterrae]